MCWTQIFFHSWKVYTIFVQFLQPFFLTQPFNFFLLHLSVQPRILSGNFERILIKSGSGRFSVVLIVNKVKAYARRAPFQIRNSLTAILSDIFTFSIKFRTNISCCELLFEKIKWVTLGQRFGIRFSPIYHILHILVWQLLSV